MEKKHSNPNWMKVLHDTGLKIRSRCVIWNSFREILSVKVKIIQMMGHILLGNRAPGIDLEVNVESIGNCY